MERPGKDKLQLAIQVLDIKAGEYRECSTIEEKENNVGEARRFDGLVDDLDEVSTYLRTLMVG